MLVFFTLEGVRNIYLSIGVKPRVLLKVSGTLITSFYLSIEGDYEVGTSDINYLNISDNIYNN